MPAEVFPAGEHLQDELDARGWTVADLVARMPGDATVNTLSVELVLHVHEKNLLLGVHLSALLGEALGVDEAYFANLDRAWRLGPNPL